VLCRAVPCCAAVAAGLESLAAQDLTWDPQQLSQAWPLLGDPLNPKDKIVSAGLYSKLLDAGFNNHLQVRDATIMLERIADGVRHAQRLLLLGVCEQSGYCKCTVCVTCVYLCHVCVHTQVLQQAPTVVKYHDSVPVDASSSSSSSSSSSDTEAGLSEDSTDGAEGVAGDSRPFVFFNNAK
jgi:hypothetical protein